MRLSISSIFPFVVRPCLSYSFNIFINEISDKILPKIDHIIDDSVNHIKLVLFGQNLDKKSKIRLAFEKNKNAGIIACYQDNHRTLTEYVREKLKDFKGINQDIVNLLISNSGLDRKVLFNEMEKIKTYANIGDWVEHSTYIILKDNKLRLKKYSI